MFKVIKIFAIYIFTNGIGFFISLPGIATTFGPISVVRQIGEAQYIVRGTIEEQRIASEPQSGQPHTYSRMRIKEVVRGNIRGNSIELRQPGGQIGERGYFVPGRAEFKIGEETVVFLQDTTEGALVKEVLGLASGKYIFKKEGDDSVLENALGIALKDTHGKNMNWPAFRRLIERVEKSNTEPGDEEIILNNQNSQHHEPIPINEKTAPATTSPSSKKKEKSPSTQAESSAESSTLQKNSESLEGTNAATDRKSSGAGWIFLIIAVTAGGMFFLLRRT